MYTNMYFFIFILCLNTIVSMINTNVFFDFTAFQDTTVNDGTHHGTHHRDHHRDHREANEQNLKRREGNNKQIATHMRRIAALEGEVRGLRQDLHAETTRANKSKQTSTLYRSQLREEGIPLLQTSTDASTDAFTDAFTGDTTPGRRTTTTTNNHTNGGATPGTEAARGRFFAGEANRLQQAARQTIAQLRSMLEKKGRLVEEYKRKLEEVRARAVSERTHDQEEIRRLTDKLYEENRVAIDKLRNAFDSIEHGDGGGGGGGGVNMTVTTSTATVDVTVDC
jgi:hypothetical protein